MKDLLSGEIAYMVNQASSSVPYLKSGQLVALGVTTPKRVPSIPDVPTVAEAGIPGFAGYGWNAILVPKGTPRAVIDKLNREINIVIASPEVQAKFVELGLGNVDPTTPETATAFIAGETKKWAPVIKAAGIKGD